MIPLEPITLIGSTLVGGLLKIWSMKLKADKQREAGMINALGAQTSAFKEAREYDNKGFQFTRRVIALSAVASIVVWPLLVPFLVAWLDLDSIPVVHGYTEFRPGFLFIPDKDVVVWKEVIGISITPMHTHLMASIAGLYFGASVVGSKS